MIFLQQLFALKNKTGYHLMVDKHSLSSFIFFWTPLNKNTYFSLRKF